MSPLGRKMASCGWSWWSAARRPETLTTEMTVFEASRTATGPARSGEIARPYCSGYIRRLHGSVPVPMLGCMSTVNA